MKLRCTFSTGIASRIFAIGSIYLAKSREGSSINAVDVVGSYHNHEGDIKAVALGGFEDPVTGDIEIHTADGVVAVFAPAPSPRFTTTEKRIAVKLDGTGQIDKRRYRRVCRQYSKLKRINAGYYCPISDAHMKKIARFHRR